MKLNIEDYLISLTCKVLEIKVTETQKESFTIYYCLKRDDGYIAEEGNKTLPIQALPLFVPPYNITTINQMLSSWNITAINDAEE